MQFAAEEVIPVTLIPGDGIGPEIVEATVMGARRFACPVCIGRASSRDVRIGGIGAHYLKPLWTASDWR